MACGDVTMYVGGRKINLNLCDVYYRRSVTWRDENGIEHTRDEWERVWNTRDFQRLLEGRGHDTVELSVCVKGSSQGDAEYGWRPGTRLADGTTTQGVRVDALLGRRGRNQLLDDSTIDGDDDRAAYARLVREAVTRTAAFAASDSLDSEGWLAARTTAARSMFTAERRVGVAPAEAAERVLRGFVEPSLAKEAAELIATGRVSRREPFAPSRPTDGRSADERDFALITSLLESDRLGEATALVRQRAKPDTLRASLGSRLAGSGTLEDAARLLDALGSHDAAAMYDAAAPRYHVSLDLDRDLGTRTVRTALAAALDATRATVGYESAAPHPLLLHTLDAVGGIRSEGPGSKTYAYAGPPTAEGIAAVLRADVTSVSTIERTLGPTDGVLSRIAYEETNRELLPRAPRVWRDGYMRSDADAPGALAGDVVSLQRAAKALKLAEWLDTTPEVATLARERVAALGKTPDRDELLKIVASAAAGTVYAEDRKRAVSDLITRTKAHPSAEEIEYELSRTATARAARVDSLVKDVERHVLGGSGFYSSDGCSALVAAMKSDTSGQVMLRAALTAGLVDVVCPANDAPAPHGTADDIAKAMLKPLERRVAAHDEWLAGQFSTGSSSEPAEPTRDALEHERFELAREIADRAAPTRRQQRRMDELNNALVGLPAAPPAPRPPFAGGSRSTSYEVPVLASSRIGVGKLLAVDPFGDEAPAVGENLGRLRRLLARS